MSARRAQRGSHSRAPRPPYHGAGSRGAGAGLGVPKQDRPTPAARPRVPALPSPLRPPSPGAFRAQEGARLSSGTEAWPCALESRPVPRLGKTERPSGRSSSDTTDSVHAVEETQNRGSEEPCRSSEPSSALRWGRGVGHVCSRASHCPMTSKLLRPLLPRPLTAHPQDTGTKDVNVSYVARIWGLRRPLACTRLWLVGDPPGVHTSSDGRSGSGACGRGDGAGGAESPTRANLSCDVLSH